ncbi:MAG: glutamate synthase central domain-containing protein, partial [Pseudanabaenaceae cyanobacterium]
MVSYCIPGQPWLVRERDSCGVGFIADRLGRSSHKILSLALQGLACVEHRGGCSADRDSGDGAGVLTAIPWGIWQGEMGGITPSDCAVGMFFLPQDPEKQAICRTITAQVAQEEGLRLVGWRVVPCNKEVLGVQARENLPQIEQAVFVAPDDRSTYITRRRIKLEIEKRYPQWQQEFYIASLSKRTIVYKGMVRAEVLAQFYLDLQNPEFVTPFAVYHRRFSTNTMPKWHLAQPMRLLGHNGEINTLLGNINWFKAREESLEHPLWGDRFQDIRPILKENESDSANLDHVFELLVETGRNPLEALMILVPEAYRSQPDLEDKPEIIDFYDFYSGIQEPWDGPALLAFSDGKIVGALLDRNGLRPARYLITKDDLVIVSSEAGTVTVPEENVLEKGRLGPGQTIAVDLQAQKILKNWEIKLDIARRQPYGEWVRQHRLELTPQPFANHTSLEEKRLLAYQTAFGYTQEDVDMVIEAMAESGKEPVFCMGDDIPLAVLSQRPRLLYDYFKQRFAQVTNPAIDPLREGMVMSLEVHLGRKGNLLNPDPTAARLVHLASPVLNEAELEALYETNRSVQSLHILFPLADGIDALEQTIETLCQRAVDVVKNGCEILVLSDRGLDANWAFIPPLLAVGAVHHRLIQAGLRPQVSLVVETAQC